MLNWANQFNIFCFLDNCQYSFPHQQYECLLAVDAIEWLQAGHHSLKDLSSHNPPWWFGHLAYELQHPSFHLRLEKPNAVGFPLFYFFRPRIVLYIKGGDLHIEADDGAAVFAALMQAGENDSDFGPLHLEERFSRQEYMGRVQQLQQHMQLGDCYEVNFCQEFFATDSRINPIPVFKRLIQLSPNPFSALYRLHDKYLICASPERFLKKEGNCILAQPMKGTARRGKTPQEDELQKEDLIRSAKERAENVMVVDLVRNDLSRVCAQGSVAVDELVGLYSFPHVHQLISTVSGVLATQNFSEIIGATFPMGSMTGAPKHRVMQLIDRYEPVARGIFSGSVGYIDPSGNFDFNVVIRSIMYNASQQYVSCQVGSGITIYSEAGAEWDECLLKAEAIKKVLGPPALL